MDTINKTALCIISYKPNPILLNFYNSFINYDIYTIIDDNTKNYSNADIIKNFNNIKFIQIKDKDCSDNGFTNSNVIGVKKIISGWDKALYYFSIINKNYKNIWFIEDDVFFYDENTIISIDNKYEDYDILCNSDFKVGKLNEWLWSRIKINLPQPYYHGMMCACRMSNKLLEAINDYAIKNKKIFFLEALFPTIAIKSNLKYYNPDEFRTITWRNKFEINQISKENIYHPFKNIEYHNIIRNSLKIDNINK